MGRSGGKADSQKGVAGTELGRLVGVSSWKEMGYRMEG
jgi:hypothetical protein